MKLFISFVFHAFSKNTVHHSTYNNNGFGVFNYIKNIIKNKELSEFLVYVPKRKFNMLL